MNMLTRKTYPEDKRKKEILNKHVKLGNVNDRLDLESRIFIMHIYSHVCIFLFYYSIADLILNMDLLLALQASVPLCR